MKPRHDQNADVDFVSNVIGIRSSIRNTVPTSTQGKSFLIFIFVCEFDFLFVCFCLHCDSLDT